MTLLLIIVGAYLGVVASMYALIEAITFFTKRKEHYYMTVSQGPLPSRAGMVVFNRAGWVLLTRGLLKPGEKEDATRPSSGWYFPKGHIETTDKTTVDAATREVLEETGIELDYTSMPFLGYTEYDYKKEHVVVAWFSGQGIYLSPTHKPDHEWAWFPPEKAKEIIHADLLSVLRSALCEEPGVGFPSEAKA